MLAKPLGPLPCTCHPRFKKPQLITSTNTSSATITATRTRFLVQLEDPESPDAYNLPGIVKAAQLRELLQGIASEDLSHVKTLRAVAPTFDMCWTYDDGIWTFGDGDYPVPVAVVRWVSREIWMKANDLEKSSDATDLEAWQSTETQSQTWRMFDVLLAHEDDVLPSKQLYKSIPRGFDLEELLCCLV